MSSVPVAEPREGRTSRWLHAKRLRLALFVAFFESLLVLLSAHGWYYVAVAAAAAVALHIVVRRRTQNKLLHEITWTLAVSQLVAFLVPLLWVVVKAVAIAVLVVLALLLLAVLLIDRR